MMRLTDWQALSSPQKKMLVKTNAAQAGIFTDEVAPLLVNLTLLDRFFIEAHLVARYRKKYSARTIMEVMRHNSVIQDESQTDYKISNDIIPSVARISQHLFPALNGLFKFKTRK